MSYLVTFLEGIITFISPCLLPMLPIYLSYFTAGAQGPGGTRATVKNALGFILGFTVTFLVLGTLAGSVGMLLRRWQFAVNIICGAVVVLFGLNFLGVLKLRLFSGGMKWNSAGRPWAFFFRSVWPCVQRRVDALRGRISRFGTDARLAAGVCGAGHAASSGLLAGPGGAVLFKRIAHSEAEGCAGLGKGPLFCSEHGVRRVSGCSGYFNDDGPDGPFPCRSGISEGESVYGTEKNLSFWRWHWW